MTLIADARKKVDEALASVEQELAWAKEDARVAREGEAAAVADDLLDEARIKELEAEVARLQAIIEGDEKPPPDTGDGGLTDNQKRFGIQVFADRGNYLDLAGSKKMVEFLGVKKVRSGIHPGTPQKHIDFYNSLYDDLGVTSCMTVGKPRVVLTPTQWDKIAAVLGKMRGVEMLCNWNEPNHNRGNKGAPLTDWEIKTVKNGHEIRTRFDRDYVIGSAQMWSGQKKKHDADLNALAKTSITVGGKKVTYKDTFEHIVWHLYQPGQKRMSEYETLYTGLFGNLPITCSETGMSTAPNQAQGALSMTEPEQAEFLKQHLGMYAKAGHNVYWFELRDDPDPAGTDREDWLGLFRADGTPKPAAKAFRDLLVAA